jgi:hypothetical protein
VEGAGTEAVTNPAVDPAPNEGKAGSGLDAEGRWTPAFPGQRPPFQPGHDKSVTWGDRALIKLRPRAAELADALREVVPIWHDSYAPILEAAAMVAAQAEAAFHGLDGADPEQTRWLDERAARWSKLYLQHLSALGLTPVTLARRGLDLSQIARTEQLRRHLEDRYGDGDDAA